MSVTIDSGATPLPARVSLRLLVPSALAGLVALAGFAADVRTGWASLLVAALFGLQIALGGALFVAIQSAGGARWWDPIRPVPIAIASSLVAPGALLLGVLLAGAATLYPWARPGAAEASHLIHGKAAWLNLPLFLVRASVIVIVWIALIRGLDRRLAAVIAGPDPGARTRLARLSIGFLVVFAVTISVAWWDWAMSLHPEWFSTMFGVYGFAGAFQGGIAATIVTAAIFARFGWARVRLPENVLHDLGKLLFGFSMFWGYIWFCQYMLIWYANLPEETSWFLERTRGGWSTVFWLNVVLCFGVPFVALLSQRTKQNVSVLVQVAVVVLAGRWMDVYLLVAPALGNPPIFPIWAVAASLAVVGAMAVLVHRRSSVALTT